MAKAGNVMCRADPTLTGPPMPWPCHALSTLLTAASAPETSFLTEDDIGALSGQGASQASHRRAEQNVVLDDAKGPRVSWCV